MDNGDIGECWGGADGACKVRASADLLATLRDGLRAPETPNRARAKQVLDDADVRKLVKSAFRHDADLGALVLVLTATGARMDQVARLTVADLVPYCLRHSSIIRGLRARLPIRLVAAVHDASAAMVEKHYATFIVDAVEGLLRRAVVPLSVA